ncbi:MULTISPECIES: ferritin [Terrabacteria group]|uniref:ferritin n=1 Tax=Bacillati TaxID=1783272 RepID=UPI00193A0D84|nr:MULTISPECIES: ferritin [Terrabacteria group]MBW9212614.1 ferritin [Trueperella sp. zg.1013]QRG86893.1 ferritin [Bulleidia sp. zg-1006]
MLNKKVTDLLQAQVTKELYSAYLYRDLAAFYEDKGLKGFAHWFVKQAAEEVEHAEKFISYLQENGVRPIYATIDGIHNDYKNLGEPFKLALEHEQFITKSINDIYTESVETKDYATQEFLNWFVKEQVEEEDNASNNLQTYEFVKDDKAALYSFNNSLLRR